MGTPTAGTVAGLSWAFYIAMTLPALHLFWQVATVDLDNPKDCLSKFRLSRDFGLLVFATIVLGRVIT